MSYKDFMRLEKYDAIEENAEVIWILAPISMMLYILRKNGKMKSYLMLANIIVEYFDLLMGDNKK